MPEVQKMFLRQQPDGSWKHSGKETVILTHKYDKRTFHILTTRDIQPVEPDRSKPYSHNWTDLVLRAFAAHSKYWNLKEVLKAPNLLKSSFFKPDYYTSLQGTHYWVSFLFWWPNLVTALDSFSLMGYSKDDPDIKNALNWLIENQLPNGLWKLTYGEPTKENVLRLSRKSKERSLWLTLNITKIIKRYDDDKKM